MEPIWRDYFVKLTPNTGEASVLYRVVRANYMTRTVLFQGRAFPRPGDSACTIRINDIIAPLLSAGAQFPVEAEDTIFMAVDIQRWNGTAWKDAANVEFTRDWSYDAAFDDLRHEGWQEPIDGAYIPGQYIFFTSADADPTMQYTDADGKTDELELSWNGGTAYGTAQGVAIDINGIKYHAIPCGRYVLYYINAYGGWDAFVVQGNTVISDEVERQSSEREYSNREATARGLVNDINTLTRQYTFYTHPLTEAQSLKMHHLLNSPTVYVHDLEEGTIRPLVLTGSTTEHKAGARLHQYTITAKLAQGRIRR